MGHGMGHGNAGGSGPRNRSASGGRAGGDVAVMASAAGTAVLPDHVASSASGKIGTVLLTAIAAGNMVGLGVMSLAGIGIGITGTGLWIAALVGGVAAALALAPQVLVSGAADWPGGQYQQIATLLPRVFGGVTAYIMCFLMFDVSAFALSAAELLGLPPLATRLCAVVIVAVTLLLHAAGARVAAVTQLVMAGALALTLGVAAAVLAPHVRPAYLFSDMFLGSPAVFVFAAVYMAFMMNGAAVAANYAGVARDPRRSVPRAMLAALLLVAVLYVAICVADAGVLPIGRVANQDLAVTLGVFLPSRAVTAVTVSGSMFALLTSLNAVVGWIAYPVSFAAAEGWLPRELSVRSSRTGAPVSLLSVLLIIAEVPLIAGIPAKTVSSSVTVLVILVQLLVAVAGLRMVLRRGDAAPSASRIPRTMQVTLCVAAVVVDVLLVAWLLYTMNRLLLVGNLALLLVAVVSASVVQALRGSTATTDTR